MSEDEEQAEAAAAEEEEEKAAVAAALARLQSSVHGSRSEQPIQESLLRSVLHAVRTT
jgi:hypothetical protein